MMFGQVMEADPDPYHDFQSVADGIEQKKDVSSISKRKMLSENAVRLFNF